MSDTEASELQNVPSWTRLDNILKLLNPPQQEYADIESDIRNPNDFDTPIERAIASYFQMFAGGYAYWQNYYDYARIHEYFYAGYLRADTVVQSEIYQSNPSLAADLSQFFLATTNTFIHNTDCENALICNTPVKLKEGASEAYRYCTLALAIWGNDKRWKAEKDSHPNPADEDAYIEYEPRLRIRAALCDLTETSYNAKEVPIFDPIQNYLLLSATYFQAVALTAELSLIPYKRPSEWTDQRVAEIRTGVESALETVGKASRELRSELHAYYMSATYAFDHYKARECQSLRVQQADIKLRAGWLYRQSADRRGAEHLRAGE